VRAKAVLPRTRDAGRFGIDRTVFELAIALGILGYSLLLLVPPIEWQMQGGACVALFGLFAGGGAGIVYHVALRKALVRLGACTRGWVWSPVACHRLLDDRGRRDVLRWFRLGAMGFVVCLAGLGLCAAATVRAALGGP
jgi:hypothetical protein